VDKLDAGKYAGTAQERADDFIAALKDTSIKAILTNRGGYGSIQLADLIDPKLVKDNPKWLIGYSDITTLHAMQTKAGVMSIHGTMSSSIAKTNGTDDNSTILRDLLKGEVPTYKVPKHKYNQKGTAEGILVGGNMATFVPLVGSDIDVFQKDGIILFMEEIGENLRNIDRMFNSIELHGVMENVKGVVLGEFVESESDMDLKFETAEELLSKYLKKYNIPVICGFPAGHDDVNVPIVMGAKVKMEVTADGATLAFDMDGEKKTVDTDKLTNEPKLSKTARKMLAGKIFSIEE
jgi:muramoyltetrapeptide carboxypeptidase